MIPTWIKTEQIATKVVKQPSKTYHLDLQRGRIVGFVDGYEAIKQAIIKIMLTEKYAYVIYDHYYGVGLEQYIGKEKDRDKSVIFASVATLGRAEYLNETYFPADYFDYVIIDAHDIIGQVQRRPILQAS